MYVATIGGFDGVHRGHQFVLSKMVTMARESQLSTVVFGFSSASFWQGRQRELLTTDLQRKAKILSMGIDRLEWLDFDKIKALDAKDFLIDIQNRYKISTWVYTKKLFIGKDQRTFENLREEISGVEFVELSLQKNSEGGPFSSTKVRNFLQEGRVDRAMDFLGRPYRVEGRVIAGVGQGKKIGFPTLNFAEIFTLLPADGVYNTVCTLYDGQEFPPKSYASMTFVGETLTKCVGPTRVVETHILKFPNLMYNGNACLDFLSFFEACLRGSGAREVAVGTSGR